MKKVIITGLAMVSILGNIYAGMNKEQGTKEQKNITIEQAVKWYRDSAEKKALYREIYLMATNYVIQKVKTEDLKPKTWGVSIDIDETTLDNSWYYRKYMDCAGRENNFSKYVVLPMQSTALPGVIEFTKKIYELGGYVTCLSNRDGSYKDKNTGVLEATIKNLKKEGVYFDQVLLANNKDAKNPGDKNPRFKALETGKYNPAEMVWSNKLPAHKVIAFLGDNIQDFPRLKQNDLIDKKGTDSCFDKFGNGFFIFPNPIYGSWESNKFN